MKIAVTSLGKDLDSTIDPCFGRCQYFMIVETDDMSFDVFDNEGLTSNQGAGIHAANFVADKGAIALLTGAVGPKAAKALSAGNVEAFTGHKGTIREIIEKYKQGKIKVQEIPDQCPISERNGQKA